MFPDCEVNERVISIFTKNEIIVRHKNGQSNRSIAKELGISKNTVNSYIKEYKRLMELLKNETDQAKIFILQEEICGKPKRKKAERLRTVFTEEVERRIKEMSRINEERNALLGKNKQQLTAALIHRTLISEGFKISESTVRAKVRELKQKTKECFIKQYYEYGDIAQYDFHRVKVIIKGKIVIYHMAIISIPKSNIVFGVLYKNEKMENFLDSLVRFFNFCGGVFKTIVFDNMSNVVKRFCFKNEREYTDELIKISNYYGFKIEVCNPYSANEKGHVENSGKVIRRDFFSLKYEFDSEEELFIYFENELDKRNKPFMAEFEKEKQFLLPLPTHPYELGRLQYAKVNNYSLVSVDGNFYSVPDKYVEKRVLCNVYVKYLLVYDEKGNLIAKHKKKDGKGEYSINIMHYIDTLLKKPKALKNSYAIKQAPVILQAIYKTYFTTNPREFLHFLKNTNAFDDFYEVGIEMGIIGKSKYRKTMEFLNKTYGSEVDQASMKQLDYASLLFGQQVMENE